VNKQCDNCNETRPVTEFTRCATAIDELAPVCLHCIHEYAGTVRGWKTKAADYTPRPPAGCAYDGCHRPAGIGPHCDIHRLVLSARPRQKPKPEPKPKPKARKNKVCLAPDCEKPGIHRSRCNDHDKEHRLATLGPCREDGCQLPVYSSTTGECVNHYKRRWRAERRQDD
jgi:hypothetical protein